MANEINNKSDVSLKDMTEAFVHSANRCRYIIVVIVFTSVLAFTAFWNTQQNSWFKCRMRLSKYALENHCLILSKIDADSINSFLQRLNTHNIYRDRDSLTLDSLDKAFNVKGLDKLVVDMDTSGSSRRNFIASLFKADLESLERAIGLCKNRGFATNDELKKYSEDLQRIYVERILTIPIPIFGVLLDVNDLGLLGGFTFLVILIWFKFSLSKELSNLKIVFRYAKKKKKEELKTCYHYLAMHQVLTVPPPVDGFPAQSHRRLWNNIPHILYCLPFLVQTFVLVHDLQTFGLGKITNVANAYIGLIGGVIFWIMIVIFSIRCFCLAFDTDREWEKVACQLELCEEVKKEKDTNNTQ